MQTPPFLVLFTLTTRQNNQLNKMAKEEICSRKIKYELNAFPHETREQIEYSNVFLIERFFVSARFIALFIEIGMLLEGRYAVIIHKK